VEDIHCAPCVSSAHPVRRFAAGFSVSRVTFFFVLGIENFSLLRHANLGNERSREKRTGARKPARGIRAQSLPCLGLPEAGQRRPDRFRGLGQGVEVLAIQLPNFICRGVS
jgi:hypothetical protein